MCTTFLVFFSGFWFSVGCLGRMIGRILDLPQSFFLSVRSFFLMNVRRTKWVSSRDQQQRSSAADRHVKCADTKQEKGLETKRKKARGVSKPVSFCKRI